MRLGTRRSVATFVVFVLLGAGLPLGSPQPTRAAGADIVISQVYGGGGNTGAPAAVYTHDFIELFNRGDEAQSLTGWSVQYASSTGTSWSVTSLSGTLQPGQYYLIQQAAGSGGTTALPTPDATGSTNMAATNGKVALVSTTTTLSGSCPLADVVDFVGFGSTANCFEGTGPTATLNNNTSAIRLEDGCQDTDDNSTDFTTASPPTPRNTSSALNPCGDPDPGDPTDPSGVGAADPATVTAGDSTLLSVTVTPGTNPTSTDIDVTADLTDIGGSASQAFFDDGTNGDQAAGDNVFSFLATVDSATAPGAYSLPATITDAQARTGSATIALTVSQPADVVISEFRFRGPNGGNDEFVELYNRSSAAIDISGWLLRGSNATGGVSTRATVDPGIVVGPGCYFLFTNSNTTAGPYSGSVAGDQNFTIGIVDNGGIALTLADNTIIDQVGLSTGSAFKEGTPLASLGTSNLDRGYERKPGGAAGNGQDTDDNSADFALISPSDPQNSSSTCIASDAPTDPSGVGAADPVTVDAGDSTLLTVAVTPGANPTSTDIEVTGDLTDIGGSDSQVFFDDGSSGDQTAGDNTFSFLATVDAATSSGPKSLPITITDAEGRSASTSISLTVAESCGDPFTPIYDIQGSGNVTPLLGQTVSTEGVVIGDYEGPSPNLRGFYIQDPVGDGDPTTSDGIFVFNLNNDNVNLGELVRVTGQATEFQDQTQIDFVSAILICGTDLAIDPTDVTFPVLPADGGVDYLERYEGMLVRLPQTMYVTEHFQLGRFGQVTISSGDRLFQPTNVVAPGAPALAMQAANDLNRIIVDDDLQSQNPDPLLFGRHGDPLSAENTLRGGDTVTGLVGVMTYTWSGNAASGNAWRVRPLGAMGGGVPDFQPANERPESAPSVGGTLQVSAFNLLNYFNTFPDSPGGCTGGVGGAAMDCRGADNAAEFDRQVGKTVPAVLGLDAHVLGVIEIENDGYGPDSAIADLVDRLNDEAGPGAYAFIDADARTGELNALGTDAIKVGLLYQPAFVTPVGQTAVLNSVEFVNGGDGAPRNRPTLVQAFAENASGEVFIVSVHHLKSKGSPCAVPDQGDGQANCNQVRVNAVNELLSWLDTDPTGTGDPDVLIIGDLNSYAREDPIVALESAGYTNLIPFFHGSHSYSFAFDGQWGNLDHAMATPSLVGQVTGAAEWHINSDEPNILDYNLNFKSANQEALFYAADQFRSSDHDPVLIGLDLGARADRHVTGSGSFADVSFELVAMQQPNADGPTGNTTVSLAGGETFSATDYHWLQTAPGVASFAGAGELDGEAGYSFLVSMTDGGSPGSKDRIRLRIWQDGGDVVFDSQPADPLAAAPTSPLNSGNLVVHRSR